MKHVGSFTVKLPITFPCLITGIILNQHPEVLHPQETPNKKDEPLTFNKKLFVETHVLDILVTKYQGETTGGNSSLVFKATRKDALLELMEVSKILQEIIAASIIRKRNVDELIKMLTKEKDIKDEEKANSEEEEQYASDEEICSS
ncbi:unnamed protein product [Lathyrus sativus]|nr:unnamed protein product [Lathyrus sativus]